MDATVVLAAVLFFLPGTAPGRQQAPGEPTSESPVMLKRPSIEVDVTQPALH